MTGQSAATRESSANYGRGFPDPKGYLLLTPESLQFRRKGSEESSKSAVEIGLADITQVALGVRTHSYPLWMHIILFPLPLVLILTLRPLIRLLAPKRWLCVTTANERYFFWVDDRAGWIDAINHQRAATVRREPRPSATQQEDTTAEGRADERLRRLKQLLEDGVISEDEFQAKKSELLKQI